LCTKSLDDVTKKRREKEGSDAAVYRFTQGLMRATAEAVTAPITERKGVKVEKKTPMPNSYLRYLNL
jgi:hypothetical protein